jgi:dienelactone hydrolase
LARLEAVAAMTPRGTTRAIATALMIGVPLAAFALPTPERVRFPSLDSSDGRPVEIEALLFRPAGPVPTGGVAAVIALHGCGGAYSIVEGKRDQLNERHAARAKAMLAAGYVVLFPDSFGPRGAREICTIRSGERTIDAERRRLDALGALRWLGAQSGIAKDRIALLGWSHGGSTLLASIDAGSDAVAAFRGSSDAPFFRAAVAFYPGCTPSWRSERWRPSSPTRIHIGAADDWTPAEPCERLGTRAHERGWPLEVTVHPGAHHGFDAPRGKVRLRADVPNGVAPGKGVHVGADPTTRDDANRKVDAFLREMLGR